MKRDKYYKNINFILTIANNSPPVLYAGFIEYIKDLALYLNKYKGKFVDGGRYRIDHVDYKHEIRVWQERLYDGKLLWDSVRNTKLDDF